MSIDVSYEYTKLSFEQFNLNDIKVETWMVGVGYRF